jgi:ATP-dependent DNA ligase
MMFDTIYKKTATGATQQWTIEVEGNKLRSISGQVGGKLTTASWTECFGKNTGKANETSDEEQAIAEATAKFTKQLEKHYHRDIKNIGASKFVKAMLAHKYGAYPTDFNDCYSQPKLDGMRCLVSKDGMFSRGGKPIVSAPHIMEALKKHFELDPGLIFDGELYASHLRDDFEKLISLAKKSKPTVENLVESAENLEYWIYDIVSDTIPFVERLEIIKRQMGWFNDTRLVVTPTVKVTNQEQMDELYAGYLADGQEGQMLRKGNSLYEDKRSKNLLKRKEFVDEEFTIVSLNEGQGNYTGYIKSLTLRNKDGKEFNSGIKGNQEYLLKLMSKELEPNSEATVRFQNLTSDGIPRFPVVYHIWDGKRNV